MNLSGLLFIFISPGPGLDCPSRPDLHNRGINAGFQHLQVHTRGEQGNPAAKWMEGHGIVHACRTHYDVISKFVVMEKFIINYLHGYYLA